MGPAVTGAASILLAVAAVAILAFTALANAHRGTHRSARPSTSTPASPVPASTMPGSVDLPTTPPARPKVRAATAKVWLRALAGRWLRGDQNNYFHFRADGNGEWIAYGQKLWSGRATPRTATTFDLSDPTGQSAAYWQVRIISGGRRLYFAGTQQTYVKSRRR